MRSESRHYGVFLMIRQLAAVIAVSVCSTIGQAQDIVRVNHGAQQQGASVIVDGNACATHNCGTCNDCVRIIDIKKAQVPIYSCTVKEICIPNCSILGHLFGGCGDCKKIEVRQLVKKYRTDETCVSKCVTAEEAGKHYEAEVKKAAAKSMESMPTPAKLPAGTVSYETSPVAPAALGWQQRLIPDGLFASRKN
jgi:hypothetical protein